MVETFGYLMISNNNFDGNNNNSSKGTLFIKKLNILQLAG
jgi:hypothetical protein